MVNTSADIPKRSWFISISWQKSKLFYSFFFLIENFTKKAMAFVPGKPLSDIFFDWKYTELSWIYSTTTVNFKKLNIVNLII